MKEIALNKKTLLLVAALALFSFACNLLNPSARSNPAAPYGVEREESLYLVGSQPRTLDPALTHGGPAGPLGHIFSGLVNFDTQLQIEPDLAAGWDISEEGRVYTFFLRPNARFHDGRPVTAQDLIFSWERALDPALGSDTALTYLGDIVGAAELHAGEAGQLRGVQALDDQTLQVRLDAPKAYFLGKLTYPVAFVVDREEVKETGWERAPNGTGPFTLVAWEDDQIMVLARNEDYYRDPPPLPHVVYLLDAGLPLARYETGAIDLVGIGGSTLDRVQDPNNPLSDQLRTGVAMCTGYVTFNTARPPFDNPLVRRAFAYGLDKERLITGVLDGHALPATGILPPGMPGYRARPAPYPFDLQRARSLLAEAGYAPGELPPLTYTTAGYGDVNAYVTAVITMWQDTLGVDIEPVVLDPFTYNDQLYAGNAGHIFSYGWCADYPDPQNFLDVLFHSESPQNLGNLDVPEIDALLEAARSEPDVAARLDLYAEIETALIDLAPAVFVSHSLDAALVAPHVKGYELTAIGVPQWHRVAIER